MRALLHPDAARVFKSEYLAQSSLRTRRKFSCLLPRDAGEERGGGLNGAVSADACLPDRQRQAWRLNSLNGLN